MATCNYENNTKNFGISAWYGADYFEIYHPLTSSREQITLPLNREELKELKQLIDKALEKTEDIGYFEVIEEEENELA